MERLLHYVWKYRLYPSDTLTTTDGTEITIIDPGTPNTDAGPDFFNAKIKVEDTVWAGSVEIHDRSSDWQRHHHDGNKAYDAVILHVTGEADHPVLRSSGEPIPQVVLEVPEHIRRNIEWLLHNEQYLPCLRIISQIEPFHINAWLSVLLSERLERKVRDIAQLLEQYRYDWNEVFYIMLTRNFGFGVNGDAFEWMAKSLPLRHIQKQRHSHSQVEALFFGQAGLLLDEEDDPYYRLLQREYQFFQKKYGLKPLDNSLFKRLRIRPNSFPHVKIAQLSALWVKYDTLFSLLRDAKTPGEIKRYFQVVPSDYWLTHYHFRYESPAKEKQISEETRNLLLINTVVPLFFAWGQHNKQPEYCERAIRLLESIPPEQNTIVSLFQKAGIVMKSACDSQAVIQLKRGYCETKKCLYCRIGFRLLKRTTPLE